MTHQEMADAASVLAVLRVIPSPRRMMALAIASRVFLDGHLGEHDS